MHTLNALLQLGCSQGCQLGLDSRMACRSLSRSRGGRRSCWEHPSQPCLCWHSQPHTPRGATPAARVVAAADAGSRTGRAPCCCRHPRDFVMVKEIGTGNASTVYYAFCKKTSSPLAIKTYKKRKLSPLNRRQVRAAAALHPPPPRGAATASHMAARRATRVLRRCCSISTERAPCLRYAVVQVAREIEIHSQLVAHPHVIDLYAAFEDNDKVYLLQEYAAGVGVAWASWLLLTWRGSAVGARAPAPGRRRRAALWGRARPQQDAQPDAGPASPPSDAGDTAPDGCRATCSTR